MEYKYNKEYNSADRRNFLLAFFFKKVWDNKIFLVKLQ